jgi:hypothetical protein
MKKGIDIAIIVFAFWTAISGIVDSDIHMIVSAIFTLLICIHAIQYRKLLLICFKGLRWKWALILLAFMVMVITSIID